MLATALNGFASTNIADTCQQRIGAYYPMSLRVSSPPYQVNMDVIIAHC
jgi:hypothetical protein